ncbi:MAG: hypothetical protein HOD43_07890 [Candidatus Marinimicrobia bacterium]|jgi:hypothetical protein|nr:hypothetical protein [Candidatus Neomarinimicrobiota bacterium]MBT7831223.1 hypothetical protein [Candidatus Neomarinimicrobiota bacterium]
MRYYRKNPAVEFDFKGETYRVEPRPKQFSCEWWRVGSNTKYRCGLEYPAYPIHIPEEDWMFSTEMYMLLKSEDPAEHAEFLALLNKAVKHFMIKK